MRIPAEAVAGTARPLSHRTVSDKPVRRQAGQVLAHAARREPQLTRQLLGTHLAPLLEGLHDLPAGGRERGQRRRLFDHR